jgi:hypothetical protein
MKKYIVIISEIRVKGRNMEIRIFVYSDEYGDHTNTPIMDR